MASSFFRAPTQPRIFVSYYHLGDQPFYNELSVSLQSKYTLLTDRSLDRLINSDDHEYVMRKIREEYLTGTSCTVVLCGPETPKRKYVDWEIMATLQKEHALVGLRLPHLTINAIDNSSNKNARLQDNIDSGYAIWGQYADACNNAGYLEQLVHSARARSKALIDNTRPRMKQNG